MAKKKRKAGRGTGAAPAAIQFSAGALRFGVAGLVVLFSLFAWGQRGVYEDGFFLLRVANNFADGHGLVYNPGEYYETNTDFLWSVLMGLGIAAGIHDILWLQLLGVLTYAAALVATFALARKLFSDADAALVALVLLGTHYSFAHFAATGFGPVLQALAGLCCLLALARFGEKADIRGGAVLGFALLFLALCRLDSAVFGLPLVLCAMFLAWRTGKSSAPGLAVALAIPSVLFGGVLFWKLSYYGDIFPATYYVKAAENLAGADQAEFFFKRGAAFLELYWRRYFLWALVGVAAFGAWRALKSGRRSREDSPVRRALLWTMGAMSVLWHAYIFRAGGDLTEFRLMTPQSPMMMILAAAGLRGLARNWRWAATAGAAAFSALHWQTLPLSFTLFEKEILYSDRTFISETRLTLDGGVRSELPPPLPIVASAFRDLFGHLGEYPPEVKIASPQGGIEAYTALGLLWVETRGWADSRIGKAGADELWYWPNETIGHRIIARPELTARLGVNFNYHYYFISESPADFSRPPFPSPNPRHAWATALTSSPVGSDPRFPPDSQLFSMPLRDGRFQPMLYFNRNAVIDKVLDDRGIERVDVF